MAKIHRACLAIHAGFVDEFQIIYRLKRSDGEWRTLLSRSKVTERTGDGSPLIASGICVDLTDLAHEGAVFQGGGSVSEIDY